MDKQTDNKSRNPEISSQSIIAIFSRWINQQGLFTKLGFGLMPVVLFVLAFTFDLKNLQSTWYYLSFISSNNNGLFGLSILFAADILRWLFLVFVGTLIILLYLIPERHPNYDYVLVFTINTLIYGFLAIAVIVGLQNLVLYSFIGWKYLRPVDIGEGIMLSSLWLILFLVVLGSRFQSRKQSIIIESLFNLFLILTPSTAILVKSLGGLSGIPSLMTIIFILINLLILIIGVDELKGKPSIYTYFITTYRIVQAGHLSLEAFRKRSAETLATALSVYKRLSPEQQEALAKWVIDNNKPSVANRFWALVKIIISTILLTMFIQEPAIIALKWFLKTVFGFSY